jgi:hypothetical protein
MRPIVRLSFYGDAKKALDRTPPIVAEGLRRQPVSTTIFRRPNRCGSLYKLTCGKSSARDKFRNGPRI